MKRILLGIFTIMIVLIAILVIRTAVHPFPKYQETEHTIVNMKDQIPSQLALKRLSGGIRIPTVSKEIYENTQFEPFSRFQAYLKEQYPDVFRVMDFDTVNQHGLLLRWKGKKKDLKPVLFLSHYDVVPVSGYSDDADPEANPVFKPDDEALPPIQETQRKWDFHPFSGAVANGRIYGRGTLDMKGMLFSIMEAAELLINEGFVPERDIWFAFGHDEEVSGLNGALKIAKQFKSQGITFEAVYDEGGLIAAPGSLMDVVKHPLALIGLGEKGFLNLHIKVYGPGGHSSMPPAKTSLVYAAEIIEKLNSNQMPARFIPPIEAFLTNVSESMGYSSQSALANQWLFGPTLMKKLEESPSSNALIRTTTAITMAHGSDAPNVMASSAEITVNFRILQGDTVDGVINHVEKLCEGYQVEIENTSSREPSALSPSDSEPFKNTTRVLSKIYPDAIVSPYITIGGTDSYKYQIVSNNIFRIMPVELNQYEQQTIHNENEHISFQNYGNMIRFFKNIMELY